MEPHTKALEAPTRLIWNKAALLDSIEKLLEHRFEWVLAGHGDRVHLSVEDMQAQLQVLFHVVNDVVSRPNEVYASY